jgi:Family of unknown function (DUF5678)
MLMAQVTNSPSFIKAPDLTALSGTAYENKWVAFSHDYSKVLASAETLTELLEQLNDKEKSSDPIFYKVPSKNSYYIPSIR